MSKCHVCGKAEPGQAVCLTCGKTYCSEHIDRRCHHCFLDPDAPADVKAAYSASPFRETPSYFEEDGFDERTREAIRNKKKMENPNIFKTIFSSPTICIIILCALIFIATRFSAELLYGMLYIPKEVLQRPWSLITYMFLHKDLTHLFFNMFTLFFFGLYLEKRIGHKIFLFIYLLSGIISALGFSIFSANPLLGASGAVLGILAATAAIDPNMKIIVYFIPMKIKYAIVLFMILDLLLNVITPNDSIAHMAHFSGIVVGYALGYLYLQQEKKRYDRKNS